jgi:uncharacterized protein
LRAGASLLKPAHKIDYGGYPGYFADTDGHPWEVVVAPNLEAGADRRIHLPDRTGMKCEGSQPSAC